MTRKTPMTRSIVYASLLVISLVAFFGIYGWAQGDPGAEIYLDFLGWLVLFPMMCISFTALVPSLLECKGCLTFRRSKVLRWVLGAVAILFLLWQVLNVWDLVLPLHLRDLLAGMGFEDPALFINWITHYTKAPFAALLYQILGGMLYYAF